MGDAVRLKWPLHECDISEFGEALVVEHIGFPDEIGMIFFPHADQFDFVKAEFDRRQTKQ